MVWGSVTLLQGLRVEGWAERTGYSATQITLNELCRPLVFKTQYCTTSWPYFHTWQRLHSTRVLNLRIGEIGLSYCWWDREQCEDKRLKLSSNEKVPSSIAFHSLVSCLFWLHLFNGLLVSLCPFGLYLNASFENWFFSRLLIWINCLSLQSSVTCWTGISLHVSSVLILPVA